MNWKRLIGGIIAVLVVMGLVLTVLGSAVGTPELAILTVIGVVAIVLVIRASRRRETA